MDSKLTYETLHDAQDYVGKSLGSGRAPVHRVHVLAVLP